LSANAKHNN